MKSILATGYDGMSYLINAKNGEIQCRFKSPQNVTGVSAAALNIQHSKFLINDTEKSCVYEYSFLRENVVSKSSIIEPVSSLLYVKGMYIIGGTVSGKVLVWEEKSGVLLKQFQAHNKKINALCFSEKCGVLLTGGEDSVIRGWSFVAIFNGTLCTPLFTLTAHTLPVTHIISSNNRIPGFISVSLDNTVKCWKYGEVTPTASFTLPSQPICLCTNEELTVFSVGCVDGKVYRIPVLYAPQFDRVNRKEEMMGKVIEHGENGIVRDLVDYNGNLLVGYQNGTLVVFDTETTEPLLVIDHIKSPIIRCTVITTPTNFNSLEDISIKKTKEWVVEQILLKKYPAIKDELFSLILVEQAQKQTKRELENVVFRKASASKIDGTLQTDEATELFKVREELACWKAVNTQLLSLLENKN
ncbi:pre-rRNA-processing protein IPI3, putative [Entamoeba invadens IP1]|uniref:Pre-rRNA-processing protein IPI3, putative n=1 Tax=Entamoeba invadens IP1 TaxID=370355 RepID=A0A0A1U562_ENTIV|nr:pre-rRNA-processing protein IPI3, putative [Entamoeba invadens IP1]ELP89445.1 pre-rRNA-processing protein IPI3, putative [Entamoeba invadens IP1]|eukprot:XP_004256216.1 pre-rRNA-processing protein IPI3, putative [Entamoeba invadens IP1]